MNSANNKFEIIVDGTVRGAYRTEEAAHKAAIAFAVREFPYTVKVFSLETLRLVASYRADATLNIARS